MDQCLVQSISRISRDKRNMVKKVHERVLLLEGCSVAQNPANQAWACCATFSVSMLAIIAHKLELPAGASLVEGCSVLFMGLRPCVAL